MYDFLLTEIRLEKPYTCLVYSFLHMEYMQIARMKSHREVHNQFMKDERVRY